MRRTLVLLSLLVCAQAWAHKPGLLGKLTGVSVKWSRIRGGLRADIYKRDAQGEFVLRRTAVSGKDKRGVRFSGTRDYVAVEDRMSYVPAAELREQGTHKRVIHEGRPPKGDSPLAGLGQAMGGMTRNMNLALALLSDRVDMHFQTAKLKDGTTRSRTRYGFKDATVQKLGDKIVVERPSQVVR